MFGCYVVVYVVVDVVVAFVVIVVVIVGVGGVVVDEGYRVVNARFVLAFDDAIDVDADIVKIVVDVVFVVVFLWWYGCRC